MLREAVVVDQHRGEPVLVAELLQLSDYVPHAAAFDLAAEDRPLRGLAEAAVVQATASGDQRDERRPQRLQGMAHRHLQIEDLAHLDEGVLAFPGDDVVDLVDLEHLLGAQGRVDSTDYRPDPGQDSLCATDRLDPGTVIDRHQAYADQGRSTPSELLFVLLPAGDGPEIDQVHRNLRLAQAGGELADPVMNPARVDVRPAEAAEPQLGNARIDECDAHDSPRRLQ